MIYRPIKVNPQSGFSMIEMLMAMFIFSFGLLGLMALQAVTTSQSGGSRMKGTASFIAHTVLDAAVAEGLATSLERATPPHVITSDSNRTFFNANADITAGASANDLRFDINGNLQYDSSTGKPTTSDVAWTPTTPGTTFWVSWIRRTGTISDTTKTGLVEFVVNVKWKEYSAQSPTAPVDKFFSVNRYVRF